MSTFSTRRRQGFDLPRDQGGDLGVYRLPAPGPVYDDTADQVSRVLAAVGATAGHLAYAKRQRSAAEDAQMVGVANQLYASRADLLASGLADDPNLPVDDEGLSGYVSSLVENEIAGSGFEGNEAASEAFRTRLTGFLTGRAVAARDARVDRIRQDALSDAAGAYRSSANPDQIDSALREIDPSISDTAIQAFRANAAAAAAIEGDSDAVNRLLTTVDDPRAVATVRASLRNVLDQQEREAEAAKVAAAEEAVFGALQDRPLRARATLEAYKGSISAKDYARLAGQVEQAAALRHAKAYDQAKTGFFDTLYSQGSEAAEQRWQEALDAGIFDNSQREAFARESQQWITSKYDARLQDLAGRAQRTTDLTELGTVLSEIDTVASEVEARNKLAVENPLAFGAVDPRVSAEVSSRVQKIALSVAVSQQRAERVEYGRLTVGQGQQFSPQDVTLADGTAYTAEAQANDVIEAEWQAIQQKTTDPAERMTALAQALVRVPAAKSQAITSAVAGIPALAYSVANETDPEKRAKTLADLTRAVGTYSTVSQVNPEVANRHFPSSDVDVVNYIVAARELIPDDDVTAWRLAMGNVRSPLRLSDMLAPRDVEKMVDATLRTAGFKPDEAPFALRADAQRKLEVYAVGMNLPPEKAAVQVAKSLRSTYEVRNGKLLRSGEAASGRYIDTEILEKILLETVPEGDRDGLHLDQLSSTGAWVLSNDFGYAATDPLTGDEALALVSRATEFSSSFVDRRNLTVGRTLEREQTQLETDPSLVGTLARSFPIRQAWTGLRSKMLTNAQKEWQIRQADAAIAEENDPMNQAALRVGKALADLEKAEPPDADFRSLLGRGVPGL